LIEAPIDIHWYDDGGLFSVGIPINHDHPMGRALARAYSVCKNGVDISACMNYTRILLKRNGCGSAIVLLGPYSVTLDPEYDNNIMVQLDNGQWRPDESGEFKVVVQSLKNIKFFSRNLNDAIGKPVVFCEVPFPAGLRWGTGIQISLRPDDVEAPEQLAAMIRQLQTEVETRPAKLKEYLRQPDVIALVASKYEKEVAKKVAKELRGAK
jgi:hypothetical protein